MEEKVIGIMGAMPEETGNVVSLLSGIQHFSHGMRTYYTGRINNIKAAVVFSRWGKVAAAATVSTLIHEFKITELLFTGVAGAINPSLHTGDIVIGKRLWQHDMDARPFIKQYEIPLLERFFFETGPTQLANAIKAVEKTIAGNNLYTLIGKDELAAFNISSPRLHVGDIASGDQFFSTNEQKAGLVKNLPDVLCVEMEGAAVAQVCYENQVPFTVIRTISDAADEQSPVDFAAFIKQIAGKYSAAVVSGLYA